MTPIDLLKRSLVHLETRRDYLKYNTEVSKDTPERDGKLRELDTLKVLCADIRRELRKARKEGDNG